MGLDYELTMLPFPPRLLQKDFLQVNPLGTVPYFVDGAVRMTESVAISQYLVEHYGPTSLAVTATSPDYPQYVDWLYRSDATLTFPLTLVLRYRELEAEARRIPQVVEDYQRWFFGRLRVVEETMADREYLCAERLTIADICVGFALYLAEQLGLAGGFKPNTAAYWARLRERPALQRALAR